MPYVPNLHGKCKSEGSPTVPLHINHCGLSLVHLAIGSHFTFLMAGGPLASIAGEGTSEKGIE